jgi:hypothetical protein
MTAFKLQSMAGNDPKQTSSRSCIRQCSYVLIRLIAEAQVVSTAISVNFSSFADCR